jgi:hypothetical protein
MFCNVSEFFIADCGFALGKEVKSFFDLAYLNVLGVICRQNAEFIVSSYFIVPYKK